jgi:hypothetical protein
MSRLQAPFRVLREAVRIIFVLKIDLGVASGFARVRKDSDSLGSLPAVLFRMAQVQERRESWRRFGVGSARSRALLSRSCNSVQNMQMVQGRINTGDCASS